MTFTVKRIAKTDTASIETKIDSFLAGPANAASTLIAAFEGDTVVFFQKP